MIKSIFIATALLFTAQSILAQNVKVQTPLTDSNTPLHLLQPDYSTPYKIPQSSEIIEVLDRIYNYLDEATPARLIDKETDQEVSDFSKINVTTQFKRGDFRLISYEWGVTYAGMLLASEATANAKYAEYTFKRLNFISEIRPYFLKIDQPGKPTAIQSVLHPHALDDAGAMCAAMIKTKQAGMNGDLDPMIRNYIDYISNKEFRLSDGTLARKRPQINSLWLDDLFMSVPALAQMGKYSGETKYFDDAIKQVLQFSERMFNPEKGLFMHGWIQGMEEHPQFHWARANGWAVMTMVELLEVLPDNYPGRDKVLGILRQHIRGLANFQSADGFWHQLIDRNDSYLETSATAIYTYAIARAVNRGYIDAKVYGPMLCLAWNAVASKVNEKGQVEGTCVGTGMGFDPAFYYYRPVSPYAAHGYGPVLLAGAEMINLIKKTFPKMNDSAIMFYPYEIKTDRPIFEMESTQEPRISVHDPVMIRENGVYYLFATGWGVSVFSSPDMKTWKREKPVFGEAPAWAVETVPTFRGHIWAPDISYHNGQFYLYYSISAFGKNTSAIGVASNKTLDPNSPDFKWIDHGKVVQSYPDVTNWNAIDPNLIFDDKGSPWFSYGSFWDGLQMVPLNPDLKTISEGKVPVTFASRKPDPNMENPPSIDNNPVDAGGNAIEAPFIFLKGKYYYLFASIDYCCKGVNSTYKMIIGRSENVQGPYIDKEGKSLRTGGGSILMQGNENWHGVGHNAVVSFDGTDYLVFHAYDAADNGRSKLRIFELEWDEKGWPKPGKEVY